MNLIISLLLWPPTDHHPQCWSVSSNQCNQYSIRNHANPDQHSKSIAPILTSHSLYPAALSPGQASVTSTMPKSGLERLLLLSAIPSQSFIPLCVRISIPTLHRPIVLLCLCKIGLTSSPLKIFQHRQHWWRAQEDWPDP